MNEFAAKKLGEVLAFAQVGNDTFEKGKDALSCLMIPEKMSELKDANMSHADAIKALAKDPATLEIVEKKAEATSEKLKAMRDLYIRDEWDNPAEVCEWLGFFEGAAIAHWSLLRGVAEATASEELMMLALDSNSYHRVLLDEVSNFLSGIGSTKTKV